VELVLEWLELFAWAWRCIWEEVRGKEISCPPCWKCEASRYFMLGNTLLMLAVLVIWVT
jgi:hypothetical protein